MNKPKSPTSIPIAITFLFIFGLYILGAILPDLFWAFHSPRFLSPFAIIALLAIGGGLIFITSKESFWIKTETARPILWKIIPTTITTILFILFPIHSDIYGDAIYLVPRDGIFMNELNEEYIHRLFSFNFLDTKIGTDTTTGLTATLAHLLGVSLDTSYTILGIVSGAGFIYVMSAIIQKAIHNVRNRFLLLLCLIGSPFLLSFCGHYEIYAPVYFCIALFWFSLQKLSHAPSIKTGIIALLIFLLNLKFHFTGFLLTPVLIIALYIAFRKRDEINPPMRWKRFLLMITTPIYIVGALIYVFITKSVNGARIFNEDTIIDVIFLPLKTSDPAPYDRYDLLSAYHFFDYFNNFFLWSIPAIFVILTLLFTKRKRIRLTSTLGNIALYALLIYVPTFFVLNPLLSMPSDWDLMAIPGISLIIFTVFLVSDQEKEAGNTPPIAQKIISPAIVFTLIGLSPIFVNSNQQSKLGHVLSMSIHEFKTYWIGSSTPVLHAANLSETPEQKEKVLLEALSKLEGHAIPESDTEYAAIATELGIHYNETQTNKEKALKLFELSEYHDPMLTKNKYELITTYAVQGNYDAASKYVATLIRMQYPSYQEALIIAIRVSLEAKKYTAALVHTKEYLESWPQDPLMNEIKRRLQSPGDKSTIRYLFKKGIR